jgi:hypothetical protein
VKRLAGLAGFEPTITGSKSVALPLGYNPTKSPWKGKSIIGNCFVDFAVSIVAPAATVVGLVAIVVYLHLLEQIEQSVVLAEQLEWLVVVAAVVDFVVS